MAAGRAAWRLAWLLAALPPAAGSAVTPLSKVLSMMEDMLAKGKAERKDEATKFAAYRQWCADQGRVKGDEIARGASAIEALEAGIEKKGVEIEELTARIDELGEDVGRWKKDKKSAADVREKESADFKATVFDYTESIDAIRAAVGVLKKQAYSRPQADAALMQVSGLRSVPGHVRSALTAFLQQPDERLFREGPKAYGYEFQGGGVVEMLEKLEDEFVSKKSELMTEERTALHAYEQIAQQLTDSTENAEHEASQKKELRAETQKAKAEAEGDHAQTTKDKKEDEEYLASMQALCEQKAGDFASRQELRAQEITAIAKAIEVISSHAVSGTAEKHLPASLAQRGVALAQLRQVRKNGRWHDEVVGLLEDRARSSGSALLSEAARQVARAGPFEKVKSMIGELINQLMQQAVQETEHKGWCDAELATNRQTREAKTEDADGLASDLDALTADIAAHGQRLGDLAAAVADLDAAVAAATAERSESKAANAVTVQEAKDAQVAVQEAMAVLRDFYASSASATALLQGAAAAGRRAEPSADAPESFEAPYQGMQLEGGSVLDFLEVVQSDFARLESETAAAEAGAQRQFEAFTFESQKDRALKQAEVEHRTAAKAQKESELHAAKTELQMVQDQLDKAQAYYDKLKPTCVESGVTYEERKKRREEEIESLNEAYKILEGTELPTLS